MNRRSIFFATLALLSAGVGFGAVYVAYSLGYISWSATSETATLVALALSVAAALVSALGLFVPKERIRQTLGIAFALWVGVSGGLVAPGLAGETPVWNLPTESAAYSLVLEETPIDSQVLAAVSNPLEGSRSTLNYVASLNEGAFVMVSSAGTGIFDLVSSGENDGASLSAVLSIWDQSLNVQHLVNLTSLEPSIRLVRGIHFDSSTSTLYLSNLPLDTECFGLELWSVGITQGTVVPDSFNRLYSPDPCLDSITGAERFGGRIARDSDGTTYLAVGDFGYGVSTVREEQADGEFTSRPEIMRAPNAIGAVVAIHENGSSEVVSRGHRNPQGLYLDPDSGRLWLSEHGPKGGDEINLVESGKDYGWPDVTYGGPYGGPPQPADSWNLGRWYGSSHGEFAEPVFSWLPAIAASQILMYRGEAFDAWTGDLLVASFKGNIHRLRLNDTRVVYDERIEIGVRPRDLMELPDGSLLVTSDDSTFLRITPGR